MLIAQFQHLWLPNFNSGAFFQTHWRQMICICLFGVLGSSVVQAAAPAQGDLSAQDAGHATPLATGASVPDASLSCPRWHLRQKVEHDIAKLRRLAASDFIMTRYLANSIEPLFMQVMSELPQSLTQGENCNARAPSSEDIGRAPEWGQYNNAYVEARLRWRDALSHLAGWRENKKSDDAILCRLEHSVSVHADVLARFKLGCSQQPHLATCQKPPWQNFDREKAELEKRRDFDRRTYKEKWGDEALSKSSCK
jgi:hypothetical protein